MEADTVRVVEVDAPEGVTVAGVKLQFVPDGNPEHANDTAEANPPFGVTETVTVPLCPFAMFRLVGAEASEKSGGVRSMV